MIVSPLRYPGGKAKLFPFFADLIQANDLFGAEYCEPYAGGAGLAIKLLTEGFVDSISLNDIDDAICAFWRSAVFRSEAFCSLIEDTPITIDEWRRQRDIWRACDTTDELALGFAAYFLNRTNRSGVIEGAGPIGGYKQESPWSLDARLVKQKQIDNIAALAKFRDQINITHMDALAYVRSKVLGTGMLFYLDPPYYVKGRKLYKNFYRASDHVEIAHTLKNAMNVRWVVSYDDVPPIRALYDGLAPFSYSLNYSAGRVGLGTEVLYLSDCLAAPPRLRFPNAA